MAHTTQRPPMRPETQAARDRSINAWRWVDHTAASQREADATRQAYLDLAATDPHCILGYAAERDSWANRALELASAAKTDAERDRQTNWAATCMAEAQRMRARAEAIMADEYPFIADIQEAA